MQETALAWGVTRRYVNMCVADGRVAGAARIGNMWLLPSSAEKPRGKGASAEANEEIALPDLLETIAATQVPLPRQDPESVLTTIPVRSRPVVEVGLALWRGDYVHAIDCFRAIENDDAARLCACSAAIAAAICAGDFPFYTEIESWLQRVAQSSRHAPVRACAELALATAYTGCMAPEMVASWLKSGDLTALPAEVKLDAAYLRAKVFQGRKRYESMLAVVQTALALDPSGPGTWYSRINLKVAGAIACCELNLTAQAVRYLHEVMAECLPGGFGTPLALNLPMLGGLGEQILKREYPRHAAVVIEQSKRTIPNWIVFHNHFTEDNVTKILSPREYEIARLVIQGLPYVQIARRMGISEGRLRNVVHEICGKLLICGRNRREQLARFVL